MRDRMREYRQPANYKRAHKPVYIYSDVRHYKYHEGKGRGWGVRRHHPLL